jgi:tetratricopeptide (TPR) repeat protein
MLTVAMIVKDEVATLERAVMSVKEYVDEVVIGVDQASQDGTRELAKKLADKVLTHHLDAELKRRGPRPSKKPSTDWGFSKARNQVLAQCKKENWRLWLDGHEILHNPEGVIAAIEKAKKWGCDGIEAKILFEPDEYGVPNRIYNQGRVFAPSVRFRNPQHNVPVVNKTYFSDAFTVEHRKQDQAPAAKQARDAQRSVATVAGFEKETLENPANSRSWFYLGNAYRENARWLDGVEAYKKCLEVSAWNEERWHARVNLGTCYARLGDPLRARVEFARALEEFPAYAEAYFYLGDMAYKDRNYREAQVWLEKCVQLDMPHSRLFVNPKIYLVDRYDLLSMVYDHLGHYAKAIEFGEKALENTTNPRIAKNVKIWSDWVVSKNSDETATEIWKKKSGPSQLETERFQTMIDALGDAKRVLDVGCGPGWMCEAIKKVRRVDYVGVDTSEFARKEVERNGGEAVASLDELDKEQFDGVILGEVLEHIQDDEGMLRDVVKLMVQGAVLVVSVPRYGSMRNPAHVRDYTMTELEALLSTVGKPEKVSLIGPWAVYKCTLT